MTIHDDEDGQEVEWEGGLTAGAKNFLEQFKFTAQVQFPVACLNMLLAQKAEEEAEGLRSREEMQNVVLESIEMKRKDYREDFSSVAGDEAWNKETENFQLSKVRRKSDGKLFIIKTTAYQQSK